MKKELCKALAFSLLCLSPHGVASGSASKESMYREVITHSITRGVFSETVPDVYFLEKSYAFFVGKNLIIVDNKTGRVTGSINNISRYPIIFQSQLYVISGNSLLVYDAEKQSTQEVIKLNSGKISAGNSLYVVNMWGGSTSTLLIELFYKDCSRVISVDLKDRKLLWQKPCLATNDGIRFSGRGNFWVDGPYIFSIFSGASISLSAYDLKTGRSVNNNQINQNFLTGRTREEIETQKINEYYLHTSCRPANADAVNSTVSVINGQAVGQRSPLFAFNCADNTTFLEWTPSSSATANGTAAFLTVLRRPS